MTRRGGWAAVLAATLFLPRVAAAQAGGDAEAPAFRIGGSARTIAAIVQPAGVAPSAPLGTGGFSQTLLRITVDGQMPRLTYEAHAVQSYAYSSLDGGISPAQGAAFNLAGADTRYRAVDASADWYQSGRQWASLWLDRANVTFRFSRADVTVGRQAVTFGKTYLWNPLDEFLPFDARQFDRDYKPGVDAVKLDVPAGRFSGVNVVGAFGREIGPLGTSVGGVSWYGSALLGRGFTTVRGWDLAAQGGKVYGGYELGGGVVGELRGIEVRGEATYLLASPSSPLPFGGSLVEDHLLAVVGTGHRFQNTLTLEIEHFHNGAGDTRHLDVARVRFLSGGALALGREITGMTATYDLLPILTGEIVVLHSWSDGSSIVQPIVTWSTSENSDLLIGTEIGIGPAPVQAGPLTVLRSEFGSYPRAGFAEFKIYF
jgi:hypothetical protein